VVQLAKRRGIAIVTDAGGQLLGVVTTGDLTRLMDTQPDFLGVRVGSVMSKAPKTAAPDELGSAVVYRMEQSGIIAVPVVDGSSRVVGVVHLHDLMRAGAA
jgi:arabinose-5-phosphate isomerase